jgi:hypothetical protein
MLDMGSMFINLQLSQSHCEQCKYNNKKEDKTKILCYTFVINTFICPYFI